ncbi:4-alpha-glucanotransferase [Georgenia sp. MJ170]
MNTTRPQGSGDVPSDVLQRLAQRHGVATEFWDFTGNHRVVPASTITAVLAALGITAGTDAAAAAALQDADDAPWLTVLPPSVVVRTGEEREVASHVPDGSEVEVHVSLEDGGRRSARQLDRWVEPRDVDGRRVGRASFVLPADLPLGWHELVAVVDGVEAGRCALAVTPAAMAPPSVPATGGWGMMAQLYSVRSADSWGIGDLADLAELGSLFGGEGADFLLINPLHAAEQTGHMTPSPYLPVTRRFVNPIYIRPEDIRECAYLGGPQRALVEWAAEEVRGTATAPGPIDRDAAWAAKRQALEVIYAAGRSPARQRLLDEFRAGQGQGLEDFALWCAIHERHEGEAWPAELQDIASPAVYRVRHELADRLDYYVWLQWVADLQLAAAQSLARASGMSIGIMHDLAVGVHPGGADSWTDQDVFAHGIGVGAPPDMYNQQGQNWSQPPWRPDALAASGYAPLRDMVRTVLRHAGAVRVDHILGLFRLWWIPDGHGAADGTYVRYDHEAMVGVLMLEAHRAGAVVIGEDLGTVEPWVRDYLAERGVLGTSVLWFEKDGDDAPLRPEEYRELVLATVSTHDLPPTAGYLAEEHVDLRERLGLLTEPVPTVRLAARRERERMLDRLREYELLPAGATERQIVEALHVYIARTPAQLVGVALVDAVGERRAQNQPGTDTEYPNWKVPLADGSERPVPVEELAGSARLASLMKVVRGAMAERAR